MNDEKVSERVKKGGKTVRKAIVGVLTTIALVFSCWQAYDYFRTPDVSGEWFITLKVEESSMKAYIGDEHGIKMFLTQTDKSVSGYGEKWTYNGKRLDANTHIKMDFQGNVKANDLILTYTLYGSKSETKGTMKFHISDKNTMNGNFSGTAANSKGTVAAERVS